MKILEDLHIFDFTILKLFIEDFPNMGIWWNKLVVGDQYYVILYLIVSISAIDGLLNNYKHEFADVIKAAEKREVALKKEPPLDKKKRGEQIDAQLKKKLPIFYL